MKILGARELSLSLQVTSKLLDAFYSNRHPLFESLTTLGGGIAEDVLSGVIAGRRGGFALVLGVAITPANWAAKGRTGLQMILAQ